jgi:hypothetical protein
VTKEIKNPGQVIFQKKELDRRPFSWEEEGSPRVVALTLQLVSFSLWKIQ